MTGFYMRATLAFNGLICQYLERILVSFLVSGKQIFFFFSKYPINFNNPGNIYLFKVDNRDTRKGYEICSKLTVKTPERCWCLYC